MRCSEPDHLAPVAISWCPAGRVAELGSLARYASPMNKAFYFSILAPVFISGCVPAPGTSPRTPQMSGRVLSATTRKPVSGATVSLHEAPKLRSTTTDSNGHFSLNESRNFHWFVFIGHGGSIDVLSPLGDDIDISHPAFRAKRINPWQHAARRSELSGHDMVELEDILLHPKRK